MRLCCVLLLTALVAAGCGLKGPLYLPGDKPEATTDSTQPGSKK
jgi:predicted small lipoprotein YifL